ncbi:MAG: dTDP-4-dehydrorhamnose reductase [Bdellovibrionales bacterium]
MAIKRVMLLGAGGQIGQALQAVAHPQDWELGAFGHAACDLAHHGATQRAIVEFRPDLVINAAAMTNVDACEKDPDKAVAINFEGVANLAAQCAVRDIPLVHLSTDYVFDGNDGNIPYVPDAQMNPLGVYGNTKVMGEMSVRHELAWHLILRVSSVFSSYGNNILTKALAAIDTMDTLRYVTDQKSCPTYAPDLAAALVTMADAILHGKPGTLGTFHYCGAPEATRFEFVQAVMESYAPYTARRPEILEAVSSDFPTAAPRPAYSSLDMEKTTRVFGLSPLPWRERLKEAVAILRTPC